jgi:hypothetical protein
VQARRERQHDGRHGQPDGDSRLVDGAGEYEAAGQHQSDGDRREAVLDSLAQRRVAKPVPDMRDGESQRRRRCAYRDRAHQRAQEAVHLPSDQADDQQVGTGGRLGDRKRLREVGVGQPVRVLDDAAVNLGNQRIDPADG